MSKSKVESASESGATARAIEARLNGIEWQMRTMERDFLARQSAPAPRPWMSDDIKGGLLLLIAAVTLISAFAINIGLSNAENSREKLAMYERDAAMAQAGYEQVPVIGSNQLAWQKRGP